MMGRQSGQQALFSYEVNLERRVRSDQPLRAIRAAIDFGFVRERVAHCYGRNGHVSVDPEVILKLMFLLFWDNVKSERELMRMLPERLDYLWFLGFGLDDEIPDHSVLSKARARWGQEVFEALFVGTVRQCVEAGLVDGTKLHVDGSLIDAHASRDSVVRAGPELITALKRAYAVEERKLEGHRGAPHYQPVNERLVSTTDPDAPCVRQSKQGGSGDSRPRYKQHRAVDDRCGVITAVVTTPGDIAEPTQAEPLLEQHEQNTAVKADTMVGDQQYGTTELHRRMQQRGVRTHLKTVTGRPPPADRFRPEDFTYDPATDRCRCPAGQWMYPRRHHPDRQQTEYLAGRGVCAACPLRARCTTAKSGRAIARFVAHDLVMRARAQARSTAARADYARRRWLMEGSFAQGANCHGAKRARWRRLWRQRIQNLLIAACQNAKILIGAIQGAPRAGANAAAAASPSLGGIGEWCWSLLRPLHAVGRQLLHQLHLPAFYLRLQPQLN